MTGVDLDVEIGAWHTTALPDGQAAMVIKKNDSVVRMEQGVITKVLYHATDIRSLLAQGFYLFVIHYNSIVQMQSEDGEILNVFNTSIYSPSHTTHLCYIDMDIFVYTNHENVITFNISSQTLKYRVSNLRGAVSVAPGCVDGNVVYVVTERATCMVHVYNATWSHMTSFGSKGTGNGQLDGPFAAIMCDQGYIFVSDYYNYRVSMFTSDGQFIKHIIIYDVPYYDGPEKPWSLSIRGKYLWVSTQKGRVTRYIL